MSNWSVPFDQLAEKAMLDLEVVVRRSTFQLFKSVVDLSPVDTGRFRGNWFPSHGLVLKEVSEGARSNDSYARLARVYEFPIGGVVYLTNNLPYAQRLEHGWSKQAPIGMVRKSAVQFARFVRTSLRG